MGLRHHIKLMLFALLTALCIAAASLDVIVPSAEAQGRRQILDQYNTDVLSSLLNGGSANYEWQQGIMAGVTGQLTRIDLFVSVDEESFGETAPTQLSVKLGAPWQSGVPAWTTTMVLSSGWNTFNLTNAKIFVFDYRV